MDTALQAPYLPEDASPFGIGLYATPIPQSALLNALTYLANYPYGCAEQTFNKLLAYAVGVRLMRTDTALQRSFRSLPQEEESKPAPLPDELEEATMPWLQLNHAHQRQQQQLRTLLDTFAGKDKMKLHYTQLAALQNADGGMAWFKGGVTNGYISTYILAAFGKGVRDSLLLQKGIGTRISSDDIIPNLIRYCDTHFIRRQEFIPSSADTIQYLYARSFWLHRYPPADSIQQNLDKLLNSALQNINKRNLYQQALLISTAFRFGVPYSPTAKQQLENIRQQAIADAINGIRWKAFSNTDDLNFTSEETVAAVAEAFGENAGEPATVKGILQWLLKNRETHNWSSTKATAAIVSLLQQHKDKWNMVPARLSTVIGDRMLTVTNDLLHGQLLGFTEVNELSTSVRINTANQATQASGGLYYYYFTAHPPEQNNSNVEIRKEYVVWDKPSDSWKPINDKTILKIADKVKTVITINAAKPLQYVLIDDKSAAGLEQTDATSGYKYTNGMTYYKSIRDVGCEFFVEQISSGVSTISYEMVVAQSGTFSTGVTSLQCMYRPNIRSYAQSFSLIVK